MTAQGEDDVKLHMLAAEETPDDDLNDVKIDVNNKGDDKSASGPGPGDVDDGDDDDGDADTQDRRPQSEEDPDIKGRKLFFKDGVRRIDYILAWNLKGDAEELEEARRAREVFEKNLVEEGLQLEYDTREGEERYLKVHAPWEVLSRYAEILKVKMPVKKTLVLDNIQKKYAKLENPMKAVTVRLWTILTGLMKRLYAPFQLDETIMPPIKRKFTLPYSRAKEYLFDVPENKDDFFSVATRSRIVNFILRRKTFSDDKSEAYSFGVNKMIADGHYLACYQLHEGHWKRGSAENARKKLFDNWAYWKCCFKFQPLDHVREYYGEKIGMYFTWLGFYTQMLIPASILGLIVFIYGLAIMGDSYPGKEICDEKLNITMCPLCDYQCPYWKLSDSCSHARASRIFDNGATVFFAIFMAFWGTMFLEFWKRKAATLQFKWDLADFKGEEQPPRPEYLAKLADCDNYKIHPVTGLKEPHLPFWRKRFPMFLMSYSVMFFLALLAVGAVIGVIAYRVSILAALQLMTKDDGSNSNSTLSSTKQVIYQNASLVTTVTAACINLLFIVILNMIYSKVALWLTDMECLRTQKEYDDSITIKLFALQFVNYYSSIVYIAFFKGRMVGRPGDYERVFGGRQEECEAGGCLIELCIQLAIIMTGKQLILNNFIEIVLPKVIKWIKRCIWKESKEKKMSRTPWEKDFKLEAAINTSLFNEYLEMVLQFGFLTIFVAAFPLGPLFALLNNMLEIRFDASKFITHLRRPLAEKSPDIGVWYNVLYGISRIAIISNAFIIALTSDFIPRLVYENAYSPNGSLEGYVEHTLSYFNTSEFSKEDRPSYPGSDEILLCRYRDYRNPPSYGEDRYKFSELYWHILAARFAFVVVFENLIVVITGIIAWTIPDVPHKLKVQVRREAYISNEIVIRTELARAHGEDVAEDMFDDMNGGEIGRYHSNDTGSMTLVHRKTGENDGPSTEV